MPTVYMWVFPVVLLSDFLHDITITSLDFKSEDWFYINMHKLTRATAGTEVNIVKEMREFFLRLIKLYIIVYQSQINFLRENMPETSGFVTFSSLKANVVLLGGNFLENPGIQCA